MLSIKLGRERNPLVLMQYFSAVPGVRDFARFAANEIGFRDVVNSTVVDSRAWIQQLRTISQLSSVTLLCNWFGQLPFGASNSLLSTALSRRSMIFVIVLCDVLFT